MQPVADIVIPIASFHQDKAQAAIASAKAQTLPVRVIPQIDSAGNGAAHTRNEGVRRGTAPFIVFLDADDLLVPTFVERTLAEWLKHGHGYVYTDWWRGKHIAGAAQESDMFDGGMYHIITTLLPRKAFDSVNGFDTTVPTLEDEDLYRRLQRIGLCAWRVPEPLVAYRAELGHSSKLRDALLDAVNAKFNQRDEHLKGKRMCSCQQSSPAAPGDISGTKQDGDVLALALYTPRRMSSTAQPGRTYDTPMMGYPMWVNPNDVIARPDRWQFVAQTDELNPDVDTVLALANAS